MFLQLLTTITYSACCLSVGPDILWLDTIQNVQQLYLLNMCVWVLLHKLCYLMWLIKPGCGLIMTSNEL